jgi:hypothetical protein
MDLETKETLIQGFVTDLLAGRSYARITEARAKAEACLGMKILPGDAWTKPIDEAIEVAVVRTAQTLIQKVDNTHEAYTQLVGLLGQQPRLAVRTSTSVLQQAYSTPIPIALLAAALADIQPEHWVYEPTAGNGALLITANPAQVIANELNGDRFQELAKRGFASLTQADATQVVLDQPVDRVIANPPFGSVSGHSGQKKKFQMFEIFTHQIDQAIAYRSLAAMKHQGRAVLILGSKLGGNQEVRSNRYHSRESRGFYQPLYENYNVIDHFTLSGELYRKQGAGFPIDIVVIDGRGKSRRSLPAADVPLIYDSFEQLKQEKLPNVPMRHLSPSVESHRRDRIILRQSPPVDRAIDPNAVSSLNGTAAARLDSGLDSGLLPDRRTSAHGTDDPPVQSSVRHAQLEAYNREMVAVVGRDVNSQQRDILGQEHDRLSRVSRRTVSARDGSIQSDRGNSQQDNPRTVAERIEDNLMPEIMAPLDDLSELIEAKQFPYVPRSQAPAIGTLIPTNMAAPAQAALDRFEAKYGNIDDFLVGRLGYENRSDLYQYFSAEQVDGAALAIASIEAGDAFVNGYQTGIGKGRICAAIMRYARNEGKDAIFVTQNAGLYADMIRDTSDIGLAGFTPFLTDNDKKVDFPDGRSIRSAKGDAQTTAMQQIVDQALHYDAVFTTYTQLQSVKGEEPDRRTFLRHLAPRSILILDEAHEAGGSRQGEFSRGGVANRAEFVRELVDLSAGAYFSSATAIKRPDVIDLYARKTDLRDVVDDIAQLPEILEAGGVPLQQMVAVGMTAGGDMMRLERSFEGISFNPKVVSVDRSMAENLATAMRSIRDFDAAKNTAVKAMDQDFKESGERVRPDNAIGDRGIKSTNFTSLMHNVISQGLMSMKAEATVQVCIEALKQGEKPVIALDNTMGSALEWYTSENEVVPGDAIDMSFKDLLMRYLDRSREVIIEDWTGEAERRPLTKEELGESAFRAYGHALGVINRSDFAAMPVSPIDYIKNRLQTAGYSVGEVTGRKHILDYQADGSTTYATRSAAATSTRAKTETVRQFNGGELDVVILNRSGSTGISLHASEKFADQRPRHMMMLQPSGDINQVMQMFGRINRTGQVALPGYTLLMSDLPAEKRPGAILARKMASLNANTTAARESDLSLKTVVDFFNPYGEAVVASILREDYELDAMLGHLYEKYVESENPASSTVLIEKVTGRIPLLPLLDQERLYAQIESGYRQLLESKQALGENDLEAGRVDLDATTIAVMEVAPSTGLGPFRDAVRVEQLDVKAHYKPLTTDQIIARLQDTLVFDDRRADLSSGDRLQLIQQAGQAYSAVLIQQLNGDTADYIDAAIVNRSDEAVEKIQERVAAQRQHVTQCLTDYAVGTVVELSGNGFTNYGVVTDIERTSQAKNPAAASNWRMAVATPVSNRTMQIPLSQVNQAPGKSTITKVFGLDEIVLSSFDRNQTAARTQVQMVTGNLIAGFTQFPKGRFVNYTTSNGAVKQGLLLHPDTDLTQDLSQQAVRMPDITASQQFLSEWTQNQGWLKTGDGNLRITASRNGGLTIATDLSRIKGGKYYLNEPILTAVGADFVSVGGAMRVEVPVAKVEAVLTAIQTQYPLFSSDHHAIARVQLGLELPEFRPVEPLPIEDQLAQTGISTSLATSTIGFDPNITLIQTNLFGVAGTPHDQSSATDDLPQDVAMLPVSERALAQWFTQAQAIGRSPEYLAKIAQTTQSAQMSGRISQKADDARCIDAQVWQAMVNTTITNARSIIEQSGTTTATGQSFVGQRYRIDASADTLTVQAKDRGEILRVEPGAIVQTQINHQDASLFEQQAQWVNSQRGHPSKAITER